ncbi:hypothetical protein D5S18_07710 [Nocardia panacis]|uniref:Uncharacterized protein n=1 Tax=Nocardia panacis TaxID=2340916 RepID=A0A3A4K8F7_9NOCA|nr:hypothetical protein D5S18_07710 [Nocardia panacis]
MGLTPIVADDIGWDSGEHLVIVRTVAQQYWNELAEGLRERGHALHHVLIDAPPSDAAARR